MGSVRDWVSGLCDWLDRIISRSWIAGLPAPSQPPHEPTVDAATAKRDHVQRVSGGVIIPPPPPAAALAQRSPRSIASDNPVRLTGDLARFLEDEPTRRTRLSAIRKPMQQAIPTPSPLVAMSLEQRVHTFGRFAYQPCPEKGNLEGIRITDGWDRKNIISVEVPQLVTLGIGKHMQLNKLVAHQFLAFFADVEAAGLLHTILSYDGSWVPRYKRGETGGDDKLSSHAWGTAVDINATWNRLGHVPAQPGTKGCILDLHPIAHRHGLINGAQFGGGRVDGMHFEVAVVLPLPAVAA